MFVERISYMAGCPYKNFEECPQHNKRGGCEFWLSYSSNSESSESKLEGCAVVLTPILLVQQINNTGVLASEVNKVGAEISQARVETIKEHQANRQQFLSIASGERILINANHNLKLEK